MKRRLKYVLRLTWSCRKAENNQCGKRSYTVKCPFFQKKKYKLRVTREHFLETGTHSHRKVFFCMKSFDFWHLKSSHGCNFFVNIKNLYGMRLHGGDTEVIVTNTYTHTHMASEMPIRPTLFFIERNNSH